MLACRQLISDCAQTLWNNAPFFVSNPSHGAYKISNYILGGIFREMLLGSPNHPEATEQACEDFLNPQIHLDKSTRQKVLEGWQIRIEKIDFQIDNVEFSVKIKIYETNDSQPKHTLVRVGGKDETIETLDVRIYPLLKAYSQSRDSQNYELGLCIIQFTLHDHHVKNPGDEAWVKWKPTEAIEISRVFFAFLKELHDTRKMDIDSLMCHSLGSLVLEAAGSENTPLPKLLIFDRALPSVWKVGCKLYNPIAAYALHCGTFIAGWDANPEKRVLDFFSKETNFTQLNGRRVVVLEVKNDWYFSGAGSFSDRFIDDLNQLGVEAARKCFDLNTIAYHERAHHAIPLNKLENGRIIDESPILPFQAYENAASAIVKQLMLSK